MFILSMVIEAREENVICIKMKAIRAADVFLVVSFVIGLKFEVT